MSTPLPKATIKGPQDTMGIKRGKAKRACVGCKRAHLTCGDERPCKRCIRRGLEDRCRDDEPSKPAQSTSLISETGTLKSTFPEAPERRNRVTHPKLENQWNGVWGSEFALGVQAIDPVVSPYFRSIIDPVVSPYFRSMMQPAINNNLKADSAPWTLTSLLLPDLHSQIFFPIEAFCNLQLIHIKAEIISTDVDKSTFRLTQDSIGSLIKWHQEHLRGNMPANLLDKHIGEFVYQTQNSTLDWGARRLLCGRERVSVDILRILFTQHHELTPAPSRYFNPPQALLTDLF